MKKLQGISLGAISALALMIAPVRPAVAGPYLVIGGGYNCYGVGCAIVSAIVGVVTLPIAIAEALILPPPVALPPPAYYGAPAGYYGYGAPAGYYAPPASYYAPRPQQYYAPSGGYSATRPGFYGRSVYHAGPRPAYYPYRR